MPFTANFATRVTNATSTIPDLNDFINQEIQQAYDAAQADVARTLKDAAILPITNIRGTENDIVADVFPWMKTAGLVIEAWTTIELIPTQTNTGPVTFNLDGIGALPVRNELNAALSAGDLQAGTTYLLRRRGNVWRLFEAGMRRALTLAGQDRTWVTTAGNLTNSTPSAEANVILQITGTHASIWGKTSAPSSGVGNDNLIVDSRGQWWARRLDSRDVNNGRVYVQWTANPSGRPIPLQADGVICVTSAAYTYWTPTTEPPDAVETGNIKLDSNGRWWRKVEVEVDQSIDISTAFQNPDPEDPVRYVIGRAADGSPLLGFYSDGSWASSPFGSIRWPGDDIVVFRTQSGFPLMAFQPDGTLVAKGVS